MSVDTDAAVNFRNTLIRVIRKSLCLPETVAVPMADELAKGLVQELGGLNVPRREIRATQYDAVLRDFNGKNRADVIRRHGISRATFYRIISQKSQSGEK